MQISIDSDLLGSTIKTLQRIAQAVSISVEVTKGNVLVTGTGNGNSCAINLPCKIVSKSDANKFSIAADTLSNAISKRKEIKITIKENAIDISSSRYAVELLINQFEKIEVIPEGVKADKSLKLSDKFLNAIRANLSKIELKPLLSLYDYIPIGIKSTEEGTFVACFDTWQSAFFFDKEVTGKLEFTLPSNIFMTLAREFKNQSYKLIITDSTVYAYNELFELGVALTQTEGEQVTLSHMLALYQNLKKEKGGTKIKLKTEGITQLVENSKAIYEKDSTFTFITKGDKCKLELKSSFGNMTSMVMLEEAPAKDVKFSCDFSFFSTLLAKAPTTLELRVNDRMLLFKNGNVTYLLSLV
jgi:hypothetical protein